jgi:hypothetical protein
MGEPIHWITHNLAVRRSYVNRFALIAIEVPWFGQTISVGTHEVRPTGAIEADHSTDATRRIRSGINGSRVWINRQVIIEEIKLTRISDSVVLPDAGRDVTLGRSACP